MNSGKRIVIVGGVAGGASAAARARRLSEEARITVFERGGFISFANCGLPYFIGGTIQDRNRLLVQTPESMRKRFGIDVRVRSEVLSIDRKNKEVKVRDLAENREYTEPYDVLILSPGAAPVKPPVPGVDSPRVHTLRTIPDMDNIKRILDEEIPQRAVVIGGGYIGLEMAEAIRERGVETVLVEMLPQVMGPADPEMAAPLHDELVRNGVQLRLESSVTAMKDVPEGLEVQLSNGEKIECGLAVLAVGVRPEVELAKNAGLEIGSRGGIRVDDRLRTSDPDIFAVGDAVEVEDLVAGTPALLPLAGPANRQGRIAADNAFGRDSVYRKSQGTAICKVFDLAIGMTGMSEKALKRAGRKYEKVYVHPASHAGYYPGAKPMTMKLLFDPENGKVLGAQAVGQDGVDKRIDVLATAIRGGMTVFDLENLELSYAPPYGSAKDPVNYAGFVAANVLRGDVKLFQVEEALHPREDQMLIDVRTPEEVQAGTIPGAKHVPVDDLRTRMGELPKDRELLVFCQVGLRGYLAARILTQNGFRTRNLSGGYKTYQHFIAKPAMPSSKPLPRQEEEMKSDTGTEEAGRSEITEALPRVVENVDARGLQCPGPIMQLAKAISRIAEGEAVSIAVTDPGFATDLPSWCGSTGNRLISMEREGGAYRAIVQKGRSAPTVTTGGVSSRKKTIVCFSNDLDRVMAAFVIANGARSMGSDVTIFFTFWGLNVLRKPVSVPVKKNPIEKIFGWMMPRGAGRLKLSKMNMGGMGLALMKDIMRKKNVASLPDLLEKARESGIRLVACTMTMEIMGIRREELIEGVEEGGVAMYLGEAEGGSVNLFI